MRRTKRRRPRVAWLPTFGGAAVPEGTTAPFPGIESELEINTLTPGADIVFDAVPLTFDVSESAVEAQADPTKRSLRDIVQGNEWRLRRIVGKAFIGCAAAYAGTTHIPGVDVALGFIVCKTYDNGDPWTDFSEVNPLSQESMEDPWIWRRRWLLHPSGDNWSTWTNFEGSSVDNQNSAQAYGFPVSNVSYGSVADGPHIDAKTQRRIHRSERLFAVLAARRWMSSGVAQADVTVRMLLDYRLLGSLGGTSYGNRGNTSR